MRRFVAGIVLTLTVAAFGSNVALAAAGLSVGDAAPDFTLLGSDGKQHRLQEYKGKQAVVLAWFPKAFTSG